jgi:hypothetical protein
VHAAGEQETPTANIRAQQFAELLGQAMSTIRYLDTDEQAQEKPLQWRDQESWLCKLLGPTRWHKQTSKDIMGISPSLFDPVYVP